MWGIGQAPVKSQSLHYFTVNGDRRYLQVYYEIFLGKNIWKEPGMLIGAQYMVSKKGGESLLYQN